MEEAHKSLQARCVHSAEPLIPVFDWDTVCSRITAGRGPVSSGSLAAISGSVRRPVGLFQIIRPGKSGVWDRPSFGIVLLGCDWQGVGWCDQSADPTRVELAIEAFGALHRAKWNTPAPISPAGRWEAIVAQSVLQCADRIPLRMEFDSPGVPSAILFKRNDEAVASLPLPRQAPARQMARAWRIILAAVFGKMPLGAIAWEREPLPKAPSAAYALPTEERIACALVSLIITHMLYRSGNTS
jgi:hypothetical protein